MRPSDIVLGLNLIDGNAWMGGAIYQRNLVYCLASLPRSEQPHVRLIGAANPDSPLVRELSSFPFVSGPSRAVGGAERTFEKVLGRIFGRWIPIRRDLRGISVTYPSYGRALGGATPIHWVPDFQHLRLPEFFTQEERDLRSSGISEIAAQEGTLVLSSHAAKADFDEHWPDARISTEIWRFCSVMTRHEEGGADPRAKYGLPENYIYLPNQFWVHKNHRVALEALSLLAASGTRPMLVCTGLEDDARNPGHMPALRALIDELGLTGQVRTLGLVPRNDQIQIFRNAAFVLQPSLFEGWSTVVEDAKALGRPLVLSDLAVHREQMAELDPTRAIFFDPRDPRSLAGALGTALDLFGPGPDAAADARAREDAEARQLAAGRAFVGILARAQQRGSGPAKDHT